MQTVMSISVGGASAIDLLGAFDEGIHHGACDAVKDRADDGGYGTVFEAVVELQLDYGFENGAVAAIIGPVFDRIAGSMVDAFIKRAEQIYG